MALSFRIMWLRYCLKKLVSSTTHVARVMVIWMLAYCAGTVAFLFYNVMNQGKGTIWEPDKTVATIEFGMASFIALCGIVISLTGIRKIR